MSWAGSCLQRSAPTCWAMPTWQEPRHREAGMGPAVLLLIISPLKFQRQPQRCLTAPLPSPPLIPHRCVCLHPCGRIGSSSLPPRRLLPAPPSKRSVGRSGAGCCLWIRAQRKPARSCPESVSWLCSCVEPRTCCDRHACRAQSTLGTLQTRWARCRAPWGRNRLQAPRRRRGGRGEVEDRTPWEGEAGLS